MALFNSLIQTQIRDIVLPCVTPMGVRIQIMTEQLNPALAPLTEVRTP